MQQTAMHAAPFATWPIDPLENEKRLPVMSGANCKAEQIRRVLRESGYSELRLVAVSARDGGLVLQGQVSCFYLKQIAQTVALTVPEVQKLSNELTVGAAPSLDYD